MNNFSQEEISAAKSIRESIINGDTNFSVKGAYMAGEICMWDELRPSPSGVDVLVNQLREANPYDHRNEDQAKFYQSDGWDAACNALQSLLKADDLGVDYIDTEGKCPNCGVEFRIHKQSPSPEHPSDIEPEGIDGMGNDPL